MSSILPTVFKATIGLLVNKGTDVEMGNLQERDVTDQEFRSFVFREINQAESEMREEDLRTSISYFKEGVIHFFEVLDNAQTKDKNAFEMPYVENTTSHMLLKYGDSSSPNSERSVSSDQKRRSYPQRVLGATFEEQIFKPFELLSIESSRSSEPSPSTEKVLEVRCEEDSPPQPLFSTDILQPFELNNPRPISVVPGTSSEKAFREMDNVKGRSSSPASKGTEESNGALSSALSDAKKAFKNAYSKATEAFHNENLNLADRIQAMKIRVAATILENLEYPEDALAPCMIYLEELHCMPDVQINFARAFMIGLKSKVPFQRKQLKEKIRSMKLWRISEPRLVSSTVCHVNRIVYDILQTVRKKVNLLMTWPCVNTKRLGVEEKVDPLRDSRVTSVLRELGLEYCCVVPWSFGHEGEEKHKLKDPRGIAINSDGEFIIADRGDRDVKVFDRRGKLKYTFSPMVADKSTKLDIRDVAIDRNDCLYVLVRQRNSAGEKATVVCVFEKSGRKHHFFLRKGCTGRNLTVNVNNKILVTSSSQEVEVYEPQHGQFIRSFGGDKLENASGITAANDGRVMVSNKLHSDIEVFSEEGDYLFNFNVHYHYPKIASHQASDHLVIGGFEKKKHRLNILIYTKKGAFVRRIKYGEEMITRITGITVTIEGRFAVAVGQRDSGSEHLWKVLVV